MADGAVNVLFLCTGNSARSIMAEAILHDRGAGRFGSFSAGSRPAGKVNPFALRQLSFEGHRTDGYRSKSWDEFDEDGQEKIDIVITVCDRAARESCPVWPGVPVTAHWGIPDPAAASGSDTEIAAAFDRAYHQLAVCIRSFLELPLDDMTRDELRSALRDIGRTATE